MKAGSLSICGGRSLAQSSVNESVRRQAGQQLDDGKAVELGLDIDRRIFLLLLGDSRTVGTALIKG